MRLLISFFLSLFIYLFLIGLFAFFIIYSNNQNRVQKVFIHQAIVKDVKKEVSKPKPQEVKQEIKKEVPKKEVPKKDEVKKTEDTLAKGGEDIKFDDIFANTPDNIPTKKIEIKKQKEMTKEKGNTEEKISKKENNNTKEKIQKDEFSKLVKKELSKLQSTISVVSNSDKKSSDYISNEFEKVWAKIDTKDEDFVTLNINIVNNSLNIVVITTNLDTILLNKFLTELKKINLSKIKNFNGKITFNTKLKGN